MLPEDSVLPEVYYTKERAQQYDQNSRIRQIQREMTLRVLEILEIKPPALILDLGCGTGLSMMVVREAGFEVRGIDIADPMLDMARAKGLDVLKADFTIEIPYESELFDVVISISTLQWIFHGFKPERIFERIKRTSEEVYRVLKTNMNAIFQFYPKNKEQLELAGKFFKKAGFKVLKIIDDPDIPKLRKIYLLCHKNVK